MTLWAVAHQAPLLMGFSRQKYWSGLPCLPPGDLPDPGIEHVYPVLQADSLLMGFSRQKYWSGLPCLPPGNLPDPGIEHVYPVLQADSLSTEPPGKPSKCGLVGWINTVRFVV